MKRILGFVLVLTGGTLACRQDPRPIAEPPQTVVLDSAALSDVLHPCSRQAPTNVTGVWSPSLAEVRRADSLVTAELALRLGEIPRLAPWHPSTSDYYRQYVGLLIGGHKVVYVNGFLRATVHDYQDSLAWRHSYVVVCDGGEGYFGAEVWLPENAVRAFAFNGRA